MTACGNERGRRLFQSGRRCLLGRKSSDDLVDHASFVLLLSLNSASCRATAELAVAAGIPQRLNSNLRSSPAAFEKAIRGMQANIAINSSLPLPARAIL